MMRLLRRYCFSACGKNAVKAFDYLDKMSNYNRFSHRLSLVSLQNALNDRTELSKNPLKTPRKKQADLRIFEEIK